MQGFDDWFVNNVTSGLVETSMERASDVHTFMRGPMNAAI